MDLKFGGRPGAGVIITGLDKFDSIKPTDSVHNYPNFYFEIAKLVPGAALPAPAVGTYPSKWVSYLVTTVPTVKSPTVVPSAPTSDQSGTMVQLADGSYNYTLYRDITKSASILAAAAAAGKDVSALGDVSYDATRTHRVAIEFYGNARGTGQGSHANTPDGSNGNGTAEIANAINIIYDFIPATGKPVSATDTSREIVALQSCNACHTSLKYHGAHRVDPRNCVLCHTDQHKYGFTASTRDGNTFTSGDTEIVNGTSEFDFPQLIHQIHMGENLQMIGHDISTDTAGSVTNVTYPQSVKNCTTCHANLAATPQAINWQTAPSREACGGCHDAIDFTTGANHGSAGLGGQQLDDTKCASCHTAAGVATDHVQTTPPDPTNAGLTAAQGGVSSNSHTNASYVAGDLASLPAGAHWFKWNIKSVSVNASRQPVWVFNFLKDGTTPVVFNTYAAGVKDEMMDGYVGGPNLYMAFAVPQDGISKPADWNSSVSTNLRKLWRGGAATGSTFAGPDASGFYTATLAGVTVPANATMITGGIGYFYGVVASTATPGAAANTDSIPLTQTNLDFYPWNVATVGGVQVPAPYQGGLSAANPNQWLAVSGQTARRAIVTTAKCNGCHKSLGVFTDAVFHAGQRNDGPTCTFCHNVNGVDAGWTYNIKEVVHSLHASGMRTTPYTWQAGHTYWDVTYPSILNNCEACHVPGSYDFSASTNAAAVPNLLWSTLASGTMSATGVVLTDPTKYVATNTYISPFVTPGVNYGQGLQINSTTAAKTTTTWMGTVTPIAVGGTLEPEPTTLVNSPISSACYACHDSSAARAHMVGNGGSLNVARSSVTTAVAGVTTVPIVQNEQCLLCHGNGKVADIRAVHMNF